MRLRYTTAVAGLVVLLGLPAALAANPRPAWVIPDSLCVRSGPGTDRDALGTLKKGDKVHVTAFRSPWCWVKLPGGRWGWVYEPYLQFSYAKGRTLTGGETAKPTSSGEPDPAWIKVGTAKVRGDPSTSQKALGKLPKGTKVHIVARQSGWCKVSTPSGGRVWIQSALRPTDTGAGRSLAGGKSAPSAPTVKAFITGDVVNLRSGPGSRFDKAGQVRQGQTIWMVGEQGMWRKVKVEGGPTGWVAAWLVKTGPAAGAPPTRVAKATTTSSDSADRTLKELKAWIGTEASNVRYGPGMEYDVKASLAASTPIYVTDVDGHWCKVRMPSGKYGWVAGWVVNFQGPQDQAVAEVGGERINVHVGWVARPEVNLRDGPGVHYHEVAEAALSTEVVIVDQNADGDWYKVALSNGKQGWIAARYVDTRDERLVRKEKGITAPVRMASLPGRSYRSSRRGDYDESTYESLPVPDGSIAETAERYLGDSYVRGGSSPGSFDCSGLVQYVHRKHGIDLGRTSRAQYREGVPVPRDQLQAGDVVFFENTYRPGISHVGIYVGQNKFIHAANPGSGVKITDLDSGYYRNRYVGARRMR
jgi:N-acetylmuramoyl-L-alanine amidase